MNFDLTLFGIAYIMGLIIPGVFFKRFYYQGHFKKQFRSGLFADRLLTNIFWGVIVQTITFWLFSSTFNIDKDGIIVRVVRSTHSMSHDGTTDLKWDELLQIQLYFISSILVAMWIGTVCHHVVRVMRFDLKISILQFANKWHYYFRGEFVNSLNGNILHKRKIHNTALDLRLKNPTDDCSIIKGMLVDYELDRSGDLTYLYLDSAFKYRESDKTFDRISGDCFLIKFSEVKDINFRYLSQQITRNKRTKWFNRAVVIALLLILVYALAYPWNTDMTLRHKIMTMISGVMVWFGVSALSLNPLMPRNERLSKKALWFIIAMTVGFFGLMIATIKIRSFTVWLYDMF